MADQSNHSRQWSQDDIQRYLAGDMKASIARQFEDDLRRDPFLRDAVDGYAGHAKIYVDHHLQRLEKEFKTEQSSPRIPVFMLSTAAIFLLAAAGYFLLQPKAGEKDILARVDQSGEQVQSHGQELVPKIENDIQSEQGENDEVSEEKAPLKTPDNIESQVLGKNKKDIPSRRTKIPITNPSTKRRMVSPGIVSGKVTDESGEPLIGANVYFPNNEAAITTDFDGKFAVELRSTDSIAIVNYTGFESSTFSIGLGKDLQFQLSPGVELNEVAISDYSLESIDDSNADMLSQNEDARKKKERDATASKAEATVQTSIAEPDKGFKKYAKYIKRNLKYPVSARSNNIEGEVVVKFKVLPNGELFDFRILQSLGYGCDEEAIRLIKDGPTWNVIDANTIGEVIYTIEFEN